MNSTEHDIEHGSDNFIGSAKPFCRCCAFGKADGILAAVAVRVPTSLCPFCRHPLWSHDYIRRAVSARSKGKNNQCEGEKDAS